MIKIKKISIILENLETFIFDAKDIKYLAFEHINEHFYFESMKKCPKHTFLLIRWEAKPEYDLDFGETDWRERLTRCKDITHIKVDGQTYCPRWKENFNGYDENLYQRDFVYEDSGEKYLGIVISPDKKALGKFRRLV